MIETLMALWNQNRRKRARQVLLTFLLMCIGISLLFIIVNNSIQAQYKAKQSALNPPTPTLPPFGNTVVPDLTPSVTVVIGSQPTQVATKTHPTPALTPTMPAVPTPIATTTQPCPATPATTSNQGTTNIYQQGASPVVYNSKGAERPIKYFDGGGGGPIGTPIGETPTAVPTLEPSSTPSNHPPGWIPSCTDSNSVAFIASSNAFSVLVHNAWTIVGSAFFGTIVLYAFAFVVKHRWPKS